jgi:uncharacterized membrane protein YsdA (DUF1294 family)
METIIPVIAGIILLLFGRRLFWLFVAIAGFMAGWTFARENLDIHPETTLMLVAVVVGLIGALVAIFLQRAAVALAGFFSGGYLALSLAVSLGHKSAGTFAFIIGGIIGAILLWVVFDWALILLSSLTGAMLVTQAFQNNHLSDLLLLGIFLGSFLVGAVIQADQLKHKSRKSPPPE